MKTPAALCPLLAALLFSACLPPLTSDDVWSLDPNGRALLEGLVTDRDTHLPLEGATVQFGSRSASAGADGRYRLERMTPGEVDGVVAQAGYVAQSVTATLSSGSNALDFELEPLPCGGCGADQVCDAAQRACVRAATLSGGIVSACTGLALSARVTIGGFSTCSLNGKAYFVLNGLTPGGPQRLAVGKQGYEPVGQDLTLQPGFNTVPDVQLTPVGGCGVTPTEVACSCTTANCQ